jgi:8-oxo-dGTP pyrophosphatase MutT (NUDIX family)
MAPVDASFPFTLVMTTEAFPAGFDSAIFLAGPSPRDEATPSWRPQARALLAAAGYQGLVLDPEDRGGWSGDYDDRVDWEAEALSLADVILFWVARDLDSMPAFTTNVEFGVHLTSGKVVAGAPPEAPKNRYLAHLAASHDVEWHTSLDVCVTRAVEVAERFSSPRTGPERFVPATVWSQPSFQGWLADLRAAGHTLDGFEHLFTFPSRLGHEPFLWSARPSISVHGEGRVKSNEVVVARPDVSAVCAHGPLRPDGSADVVLVGEFRSAGRQPGGLVVELPGGSMPADPTGSPLEESPATTASVELFEETGVRVDASRLTPVSTRQLASTLVSYRCHLFEVELTPGELGSLRGRVEPFGELVDDGEVTWVQVVDSRDLLSGVFQAGDFSTVGMVAAALAAAAAR